MSNDNKLKKSQMKRVNNKKNFNITNKSAIKPINNKKKPAFIIVSNKFQKVKTRIKKQNLIFKIQIFSKMALNDSFEMEVYKIQPEDLEPSIN